MTISILAVGTNMPQWVNQSFEEYSKRLNSPWNVKLQEITAVKRGKNASIESILDHESKLLWRAKPANAFNLALDRQGKIQSSSAFAELLDHKLSIGIPINFLIGGPEGLSTDCIAQSDQRISLSAMTFPHPLVRVILIEQIYRAWSIINRHPYHR